jgi:hypothetical protein
VSSAAYTHSLQTAVTFIDQVHRLVADARFDLWHLNPQAQRPVVPDAPPVPPSEEELSARPFARFYPVEEPDALMFGKARRTGSLWISGPPGEERVDVLLYEADKLVDYKTYTEHASEG